MGEGLFSEKMLRESINWLRPFATCNSTVQNVKFVDFGRGYITKQLQCIRNFKVVFRNFQHEVCVPIKTSQKACAKTFFRRAITAGLLRKKGISRISGGFLIHPIFTPQFLQHINSYDFLAAPRCSLSAKGNQHQRVGDRCN